MIKLTKLNGIPMLINSDQIEYIEAIPESKIIMMNGEYHLAKESMDTIIERVIEYKQRSSSVNAAIIKEALKKDSIENL